jgi:hypothetical protein
MQISENFETYTTSVREIKKVFFSKKVLPFFGSMSHNKIIMRSKNILSIVAFVAAFGLSAAFASLFISENTYSYNSASYLNAGQNTATAEAITALILEDYVNGHNRDKKIYDLRVSNPADVNSVAFADYAEAMEGYVDDSSSMDANDLPRDFQSAWQAHMSAWRDYSNFLNESADISGRTACSLRKFKSTENMYNREISRTWYEVLRIGGSYGADVR